MRLGETLRFSLIESTIFLLLAFRGLQSPSSIGKKIHRAPADAVGVQVVVADGGRGGPGRAADEGVDRVVQGPPEAEMVAGGSYGVQGSAHGAACPPVGGEGPALSGTAVGDDAASRATMACDASGGDLRQTGFQSWKARKAALQNQKRALARARKHP